MLLRPPRGVPARCDALENAGSAVLLPERWEECLSTGEARPWNGGCGTEVSGSADLEGGVDSWGYFRDEKYTTAVRLRCAQLFKTLDALVDHEDGIR